MSNSPKKIATKAYKDPDQALEAVSKIYDTHIEYLRGCFRKFVAGDLKAGRYHAFYPYVKISTKLALRSDSRLAYGFAPRPGTYSTTLTRPDIYAEYFREQFRLIIKNHDVSIKVGVSDTPIPVHFALGDEFHLEGDLSPEQLKDLPDMFDVPDLDAALKYAALIPAAATGTVEVRPVMDLDI